MNSLKTLGPYLFRVQRWTFALLQVGRDVLNFVPLYISPTSDSPQLMPATVVIRSAPRSLISVTPASARSGPLYAREPTLNARGLRLQTSRPQLSTHTVDYLWIVPVWLCAARGQACGQARDARADRSEEHTSELQSRGHLVCRLLVERRKNK